MRPPSLAQTFWTYFRLGNTTFGGGDPTMAALQRELVDRHGWLKIEDHGIAFGLARVTPGTNILAYCAATGWMLGRFAGSFLAVGAVCVPTAVLAAWLVAAYDTWGSIAAVSAAVSGIVAAAAGMMTAAGVSIIRARATGAWRWPGLLLVAAAVALTRTGALSPFLVLVAAGTAGFLAGDREWK
jgi:chromate transporter